MHKSFSFITFCVMLFSGSTYAAVLFDNGTTINSANTTWNDTFSAGFTIYDDFQLAQAATITDIDYSIFAQSASGYSQTYISILDAIGGTTIVSPFASTGVLTSNGLTTSNANVPNGFDVDLSGLSISLGAGTYALGLSTDMNTGLLASIGSGDTGFGSALVQNTNLHAGDHMAFSIEGTTSGGSVPSPATLALLGLGLAGIGYQRRKQNKAA